MNKIFYNKKIFSAFVFVFLLVFGLIFFNTPSNSASNDAIAMRVFPNPEHLSALSWYKNQNFVGSPQSIQVDGYEAVRDGHSVYVNVANITGSPLNKLYTNIYLITYNQNADNETEDIFGNIIKNWRFNSNLFGSGYCVNDGAKVCVYDADCSFGDYCNSIKARVIRDTKRLSDLVDMKISLEKYFTKTGNYPSLSAGTYLPGKSLSVWPSWTSTLSSALGTSVPTDPINEIGTCPAGYNEKTCWNDFLKQFATTLPSLPASSLIYTYTSYGGGTNYDLCATFESPYNIVPAYTSFTPCVPSCIDLDGDGYGIIGSVSCAFPSADCNDTPGGGASIHPGANDICGDGIDQDCNGVDSACAATCVDNDGDLYDNCDTSNPTDTDGQPADCNDSNPNINPGEPEICDGIDNNCSGVIDEGCDADNDNFCSCFQVFVYGSSLSTCSGTDTTNATTIANTCDCSDSSSGVNPSAAEQCDGIDNNCSLGVDENCDNDSDGYCSCSANIIIGSNLSSTCSNTNTSNPFWIANTCDCLDAAGYGAWNPGVATETNCTDGLDNDCDGSTDAADSDCLSGSTCVNGQTQPCGISVGQCQAGVQTCTLGNWGSCVGEITPTAEICDGIDNNCDGTVDESCACVNGQTQPCGISVGQCQAGVQTCTLGNWGSCVGEITPTAEICDGIDNDCDSLVDEEITKPLNDNQNGVCLGSLKSCSGASGWVNNYSGVANNEWPNELNCSDGFDNDCDGSIDCADSDCGVSPFCTASCTFPITLPCTF